MEVEGLKEIKSGDGGSDLGEKWRCLSSGIRKGRGVGHGVVESLKYTDT